MKQDRSDKFFKLDMLESFKLGICLSEERRKSFESNIQSKKSTFLEVSSNVSGTSQISTKDNRACSDNFVGNSYSPVTVSLNDISSVNLGSILDSVSQTEANTSNSILLNQNPTEIFQSLSISAPSNDFDQSKNDRFDTSESDRDKIKR